MNNFDERQVLIKLSIMKHMFWILFAGVFVNAFLARFLDIIWADAFHVNSLIGFAAIAVGSIEMIFREVYFTHSKQQWIIILFGVCGTYLFIANIIHLSDGEAFISDGALSERGGSFIFSLMMLSMGIGGGIKFARDKLKKNSGEEE